MLSKQYLADPSMSQSKLKKIFDGVDEFKFHLDNPITEQTDAMRLGSAVHLLLLEPHKRNEIVVLPKLNGATREGKIFNFLRSGKDISFFVPTTNKVKKQAEYFYEVSPEEFQFIHDINQTYGQSFKEPNQFLFLTEKEFLQASAMVASVKSNEDAMAILDECNEFEVDFRYTHKGINFKCQLDGLGYELVTDLKTTIIRNNPEEIRREIIKRMYHFQAASYLIPTRRLRYCIIFVRSEEPYTTFTVQLSEETLMEGQSLFDSACDMLNHCLQHNPKFIANHKLQII